MTNTLYFGDNLHVLREYVKDESVDLIYLDPPFNKNESYSVFFGAPAGKKSEAQSFAFEDTWHWDTPAERAYEEVSQSGTEAAGLLRAFRRFLHESDMMAYLAMMTLRLLELRRVLAPRGSIYLHCDPTSSHFLKLIMDSVFGPERFVNEIIWKRYGAHNDVGQGSKHFGRVHDSILFYSKDNDRNWIQLFTPLDPAYVESTYRNVDDDGERFTTTPLTGPGGAENGNPVYEWNGHVRAWRYSRATMQELHDAGKLYYSKTGYPRQKLYLRESKGVPVQDMWSDIASLSGAHKERIGYPTQKPLALLERIIRASSRDDAVVLDPFCGCGTAIHAAQNLGRRWIGIDVTHVAIQIIEDRLRRYCRDASFEVIGRPVDYAGAQELADRDKYQFQWWATWLAGGQPRGGRKKGADRGVDGEIFFKMGSNEDGHGVISVKGGTHVTPGMVSELCAVREREGADVGIFICLGKPTRDMRANAAAAGMIDGEYPRVQILTIDDLLAGRRAQLPPVYDTVAAAAADRPARRSARRPTPEELRREPELPPMPLPGRQQPALPLSEPVLSRPRPARRRAS